jgi:hypothetical protein
VLLPLHLLRLLALLHGRVHAHAAMQQRVVAPGLGVHAAKRRRRRRPQRGRVLAAAVAPAHGRVADRNAHERLRRAACCCACCAELLLPLLLRRRQLRVRVRLRRRQLRARNA